MRKLLAIAAAVAALLCAPASAFAQSLTFSPGQLGPVGPVISATDQSGNPRQVVLPTVQIVSGVFSRLNITSSTLVAPGSHRVAKLCVITAGSAAGTLNDVATTGGAAVANEVYSIPNAVGCVSLDWPFANGIVVVPGTSQAVSISYN